MSPARRRRRFLSSITAAALLLAAPSAAQTPEETVDTVETMSNDVEAPAGPEFNPGEAPLLPGQSAETSPDEELDKSQVTVAGAVGIPHPVVCTTTAYIPERVGNKIYGTATKSCNARPDVSYFYVQLQRLEAGVWRNYGAPVKTSSTSAGITLTDWVYCPGTGYWSYRTKAHSEGFHGTWDYDNDYSAKFRTNC